MLRLSTRFSPSVSMAFAALLLASQQTILGQDGILQTSAGTGDIGNAGDGGPATKATFTFVTGLAATANATTYIVDSGASVIRTITPDGTIHTICGTAGVNGYQGDGGLAQNALLSAPNGVAVDSSGVVYITDTGNNVVRKVDASGVITTFAGTGGGSGTFNGYAGIATEMELNMPVGIAVDASGNVYLTSTGNGLVHRITPDGELTTVVGDFEQHGSSTGDGGPAVAAGLNRPTGISVGTDGTLYIAEQAGQRVRKVAPDGIITTFAGNGTPGYSGDGGSAESAQLNFSDETPGHLAQDAAGNLLIADSNNCAIRRVTPSCCIETLAGNGTLGYSGDGRWAFDGQLSLPYGVAALPSGDVAIADTLNFRLRQVQQNFSTGAGNNVAVSVGAEAALTFSAVASAGTVTVDVRRINQPPVAGDLQLGSDYVDINTSAVFTGVVDVTLPYNDPDPTDPPAEIVAWDLAQRVLHYAGGAWQDATKEIRTGPNEIVAEVSSLSPFAVVKVWPGYNPVNFRRGDANSDGTNDVSDAVRILLFLFVGGVQVACVDAADVNDDGWVNITDAIALLYWLFLGGDEIPPPGGFGTGIDMTDDPLGCASYP